MVDPQPFKSWVSQFKLLDDFPTGGDSSSDMLGLSPIAESIARSFVESEGKPLVVHVDGAWGRGKTSFCHMLEKQLREQVRQHNQPISDRNDHLEVKVAWYVASDAKPAGQRAVMYQVLRAVLDRDPEEIASLMGQFDVDGDSNNGEPTFDRFRTWLAQELGWARGARFERHSTISLFTSSYIQEKGKAESTNDYNKNHGSQTTGQVQVTARSRPRKLVVIIIDDLDRCGPPWVAQLLDTVRRYVNCKGVSFVVAADRTVIETAFKDVVSNLSAEGTRSSADALEKYIRYRVEMPRWNFDADPNLGKKLAGMQRALNTTSKEFPLLKAPTLDLALGVAFKFALYLPQSLSVRRLKRLLNCFVVDIARLADMANLRPEDLTNSEGGVWHKLAGIAPRFDSRPPTRDTFAAHYFGRLIVAALLEVWPDVLGVPLDSEEFEQRIRTLQLLGCGIQSNRHAATLSLGLFKTVVESIIDNGDKDLPPIEIKRELCEFIASVYAELDQDGRFVPRRASFHTNAEPLVTQPWKPESAEDDKDSIVSELPSSGQSTEESYEASTPSLSSDDLGKIATDLDQLLSVFEQQTGVLFPAAIAWIIEVAKQLDPEPPPGIRATLKRFSQCWWPDDACFAVCEFSKELIRLGFAMDAYDLVVRFYETVNELTSIDLEEKRAYAWCLTEILSDLAATHTFIYDKLGALENFPPIEAPDCAGALRAARTLIGLDRNGRPIGNLDQSFVSMIVSPLIRITQAIPDFAWPAQLLLKLIGTANDAERAAVRMIGEQVTKDGMPKEVRTQIALAAVRILNNSPSDYDIARTLYDYLERVEALPVSELHSRALLYRNIGEIDKAGRCWEQAYRQGHLSEAGRREFQLLLEQEQQLDEMDLVIKGDPLPEKPLFSGEFVSVIDQDPNASDKLILAANRGALDVLQALREIPDSQDDRGILGELVPKLLLQAHDQESTDKVRVEAQAWSQHFTGGSRATIDLARGMEAIELYSEARETIQYGIEQLLSTAPGATQLTWRLIAAEVSPFQLSGLTIETDPSLKYLSYTSPRPPLGKVWDTGIKIVDASHAPFLAQQMLKWMSQEMNALQFDPPPYWFIQSVAAMLKSRPLPIVSQDALATVLIASNVRRDLGEETYAAVTKHLILNSTGYTPEFHALAEEVASSFGFTASEYVALAESAALSGMDDLVQRYWATAYIGGERGPWTEEFFKRLAADSDKEIDEKVFSQLEAGEPAPGLAASFTLFKLMEDTLNG